MRSSLIPALVTVMAQALPGQTASRTTLVVRDASGTPVSWAMVRIAGSAPQIADDSGRMRVASVDGDSIQVSVRRIGYRPFDGWVHRSTQDGTYSTVLPRLALALDTVRVTAAAVSTPLARTGFYDRVDRVRRGAINAEFITPEELEERNQSQLSQIFSGRRYTTITQVGIAGRQVSALLGRGQCAMTILVDGMRVTNSAQDLVLEAGAPQSIRSAGSRPSTSQFGRNAQGQVTNVLGLDDIVGGLSVMAIEIYPSTANAPAELIPLGGRGSCGFVAIWTGGRRERQRNNRETTERQQRRNRKGAALATPSVVYLLSLCCLSVVSLRKRRSHTRPEPRCISVALPLLSRLNHTLP